MNNLTIYQQNIVKKVASNQLADVIKPLMREIFVKKVFVQDVTFGQNNINLAKVAKGQEVVLVRQPALYDDMCVVVQTQDGDSLGEINEFDNQMVANLMDAGKKFKAQVADFCATYDSSHLWLSLYLLDF